MGNRRLGVNRLSDGLPGRYKPIGPAGRLHVRTKAEVRYAFRFTPCVTTLLLQGRARSHLLNRATSSTCGVWRNWSTGVTPSMV
jgi:hypothetical protein